MTSQAIKPFLPFVITKCTVAVHLLHKPGTIEILSQKDPLQIAFIDYKYIFNERKIYRYIDKKQKTKFRFYNKCTCILHIYLSWQDYVE